MVCSHTRCCARCGVPPHFLASCRRDRQLPQGVASRKPHHTRRPTPTIPAQSYRHVPRCNCRGLLRAASTPTLGSSPLHMSPGTCHAGALGTRSQGCSQYYQLHQTHLSESTTYETYSSKPGATCWQAPSCRLEWPGCVLAAPRFKPQPTLNAPQSHKARSVVGVLQLLHNMPAACSSCTPWLWVNIMHS